jgi:hypothetical protein
MLRTRFKNTGEMGSGKEQSAGRCEEKVREGVRCQKVDKSQKSEEEKTSLHQKPLEKCKIVTGTLGTSRQSPAMASSFFFLLCEANYFIRKSSPK